MEIFQEGGRKGANKQTNKQTTSPKTKPRTNIALATTLHGRDAAKGVKGDFCCCCCFEISTLSPSHPLEIPKAKQHVPRVGLSSV